MRQRKPRAQAAVQAPAFPMAAMMATMMLSLALVGLATLARPF